MNSQAWCLQFQDFSMSLENKKILQNIDLDISKNKITAIIGPSGSGKSTLLNLVNRINELIMPAQKLSGRLLYNGSNIYSKNTDLINLRSEIGSVAQNPRPFPKSIFENVVFGLKLQGITNKRTLNIKAQQVLEQVSLWKEVKDILHRNAYKLSAGQMQRLVLARALVLEPKVLLLDEITAALDPLLTLMIEELLFNLKKEMSIVMVTHNMQQAARIADNCVFMEQGKIIEAGTTEQIFTQPELKRTEDYITGRLF